jgi:hypothetical protein
MAVRTGTQLKSDLSSAESAVDTLISSPTIANRDAAVTALNTAVANAKDSRLISATDAKGKIHQNFVECADALRHEILNSSAHHASATEPVGPASVFRSAKRTYLGNHGPWRAYASTATTD